MKAISITADGRQAKDENLLMAAVNSDDAQGPHILIADTSTGKKVQLIFSVMEILQLHNWSYDVLKRNGKIGDAPGPLPYP